MIEGTPALSPVKNFIVMKTTEEKSKAENKSCCPRLRK